MSKEVGRRGGGGGVCVCGGNYNLKVILLEYIFRLLSHLCSSVIIIIIIILIIIIINAIFSYSKYFTEVGT